MKKLISVFGPSDCTPGELIYDEAALLGAKLADAGFGVINGGYDGVMEAVSRGAVSAGGGAVGVTAEVYEASGREPNEFITKEVKVKSHTDRLMELLDLADAYVAIGLSPGTLEEVTSAWNMMCKGFIQIKPLILIGIEWRSLCDVLFTQEYYAGKSRMIKVVETTDDAVHYLAEHFGEQERLPELEIVSIEQ
jgi:hypothetical protein